MARYGKRGRGPERVPDWVLGGTRRHLVLDHLRDQKGWAAIKLAQEIGGGQAWVFEVYRVLKAVGALEEVSRGSYCLAREDPMGKALIELLDALAPFRDTPVDRPPSRRDA